MAETNGQSEPQPADDFGSSVFIRPLRRLLDEGIPPGRITVLALGPTQDGDLPFGAITLTGNQRLVFWPIMPKGTTVADSQGETRELDHVTLELANRKSHFTWFDADGARKHHSAGWQLHSFESEGVALWMQLMVRREVLQSQVREAERLVKMPTSDAERRKAEFVRFAKTLRCQRVLLPPTDPIDDFVFVLLYLRTSRHDHVQLTSDMVLCGGGVDDAVEGWREGSTFGVQAMTVDVGEAQLLVATACPPGHLKADTIIGLPRRTLRAGTESRI